MKKERKEMKITFCIGTVILLMVTAFTPLVLSSFFLPPLGGGMVHCDPQLTDNIRLPVPTKNVGLLWYRHSFGGEKSGTVGNGIAGNGRIAASTFGPLNFGHDSLILYDYYGNRIWSSGYGKNWSLNFLACSSTPMVDIHDRVVACDNNKIILVNASNHSIVHVDWISNITSGGLPYSPTIVENNTIILPTDGGPVYAFDVQTGRELAHLFFWDNSSSQPFYQVRRMNWSDFMTILSNPLDCPYYYYSTSQAVEWNSTVPYGIMPIPTIFYEGTIAFITDRQGVVTAVNMTNGSILAINSLGTPELVSGGRMYSTKNSACVKNNRTFITTEFNDSNITYGRLYAVNVNPDAQPPSDRLKVAWHYSFYGHSQASPTLIGDTIYFDGYNGTDSDPHIYAFYTNGTLRWKIKLEYQNVTQFSFSKDPRGGFWYEDTGVTGGGKHGGRKLFHFNENGTLNETIDMKTILNESYSFSHNCNVYPCSDLMTCGNATNTILIVSANYWFGNFSEGVPGRWVVAINLSDHNKLLWKVPLKTSINTYPRINWVDGGYTILTESSQPRLLFPTMIGGVYAIGIYPNCRFQNTSYRLKDSPNDINSIPDSIQINYTIRTSMSQDHVKVKAILSAEAQNGHPLYPLLYTNSSSKNYSITSTGITDSINVSLKKNAPFGKYKLTMFLFNSTGVIENQESIIGEELGESLGRYANDSYKISDLLMGPLNDIPQTPTIWSGPTGDLKVRTSYPFNVSTTDPDGDSVIYQWNWRANKIIPDYTWSWPLPSGVNYTQQHQWLIKGNYEVRVRARDIYSPTYSNWSQPFQVQNVAANFMIFTPQKILANQQAGFQAINYGAIEPANYTWDLDNQGAGEGMSQAQYGCYVTCTYTATGSKYQTLTVRDALGNEYTADHTTQVLYVISNFTVNRTSTHPNCPIHFTNASLACTGHSITNVTWNFGDQTHAYTTSPTHSYANPGTYNVTLTVKHSTSQTDTSWQSIFIDTTPPVIRDLTYTPYFLVSGANITFYADIYENESGISQATVNVTTPQNTTGNYTMTSSNETYYSYAYSYTNTWTPGIYNFSVWATDKAGNRNHTEMFWFKISDASPDNSVTGVSINPTLTVQVNDPNNGWANVSFYQYFPNSTVINSENDWKAGTFTNTRTDGSGNLILANDTSPYGTGADGDYTVTSSITLTGNKNYRNLTIQAGKILNTAGYTVKVSGKLLNYGTITDSTTGGSGGSGGAGGGGQDFKQNSGGPKYAQAGSSGNDGSAGSKPGSGHGGRGGAGGGGGGGAWHNLSGNDADGGNGGTGGAGGKGGGFVNIFAFKFNNQGVINANGTAGSNGANGVAGAHKDFTYLGNRDISGGGGGGGGGGNGGSSGTVNITYGVLLNQGKIYAVAGAKGTKGTYGSRQYNTYGVNLGGEGNGNSGGSGNGAGNGGAGGKGKYSAGYSDNGLNGNDGNAGASGTIRLNHVLNYVLTGGYCRILNAGSVVEWTNPAITATIPMNASVVVNYGENTTGSWRYYEDITSLPACRWLKVQVNLTTNNITLTPSVDKISLSTRSLLRTNSRISDGTNATFQWTGRSLNTWYYWQVRIFNPVDSAYSPVWNFKTITA